LRHRGKGAEKMRPSHQRGPRNKQQRW
jgi:hypothetical protein